MMTVKTLEQLLQENIISQSTYNKVFLSKQYIERKYNLKFKKNNELKNFFSELSLSNVNPSKLNIIKKELFEQEKIKFRKSREKQTITEYKPISIIGRGAFGEVFVCMKKDTEEIVAIKKIKKDLLIQKNQVIHIINEQRLMSNIKSPWIVELKASFQENDYLYLVMEYCPGGDLMNLLITKDILSEKEAKFYLAELILAIESIHKFDCIHRDIKPDNILIDSDGHIKLSDFGLSKISEKIFEENNNNINNDANIYTHNKNYSCVGTAFYVAPEVLNKTGYDKEIDWWSAGIIFYEMLVGYSPFCSKETSEVCYKVMNWKKFLEIPKKAKMNMSDEAQDLIYKMINNKNIRLGKNGVDEIKKHPFFGDIDWNNVRKMKAPFIPLLDNEYDTKYFNSFEEIEPFYPKEIKNDKRKDIEFLGYTYKKEYKDYEINEKNLFDKIKNSILNENKNENVTNNKSTICRNSNNINTKKNSFKYNNKHFSQSNKTIKSLSRNQKKVNKYNLNNINNTINNEVLKLNVIKLPKKKSKQCLQKIKINDFKNNLSTNCKSLNNTTHPNNKKNTIQFYSIMGKTNKKIKRYSPKPNYNLLYKLLNFSKDQVTPKINNNNILKSRSQNRTKINFNIKNDSKINLNLPKKINNTFNSKQNELKKNMENNGGIKIINIIQNKNYNNIVHHNMNNNKTRKVIKSKK